MTTRRTVPAPRIEVLAPASRNLPAPAGRRPRAGQPQAPRQGHLRSACDPPARQRAEENPRPLRRAGRPLWAWPRSRRPTAGFVREFDVRPNDRNGALPGDIVWIEETGGALARRARVVERIGPMSDPRTVSLISIAANDIPIDFPESALAEAEEGEGRADRPPPRPAERAAGHDRRRGWPATSTTRCTPKRIPTIPTAGASLVAIADVAWYVRHDRPLDRAAYRAPGNLGLLPPIASCRCCPSSSPITGAHWSRRAEDRPVLVAEMWIDGEGHLKRHKFPPRNDALGRAPDVQSRAARHGTARRTPRSSR